MAGIEVDVCKQCASGLNTLSADLPFAENKSIDTEVHGGMLLRVRLGVVKDDFEV